MRTVDVYLPDETYIDHESIAASEAFREFVRSREYSRWARAETKRWESTSEHAKAYRERQRKEGER